MQSNIIIIIPHYNDCRGLQKTLLSIDEDTPVDIVIIDDGSKEKPIIESLVCKQKIFFKFLENNSGIEIALNFGIDFALQKNYQLIGRLDCGDVCHKNKFTKQINYLQANEDVKLLGCWVRVLDESNGFKFNLRHSEKYEDIKKKMYLNSTFVHPTVVFRAEIINVIGKYPTNRKAAEDYAFFFKVISRYKAENYPEILLDYIMSKNSISNKNRKKQVYNRIRVLLDNFYFGFTPVYAIARNLMLLMIPVKILTFMKSKIYR
jgi:glycosyltransferase involved in cell wall biosynthesis